VTDRHAHEDRNDDPRDVADSYVLLDDKELFVAADALRCLACHDTHCDCDRMTQDEHADLWRRRVPRPRRQR
jgi:hypothetical protein